MRCVRTMLAAALVALPAGAADAVTLVGYVSANTAGTLAADTVAPGVTADGLARGPGLGQNTGGTFNSNGWGVFTTAAEALADGSFLTWGFTSSTPFDLETLGIRYDRSGTGPDRMVIELNANGLGFAQIFADDAVSDTGETVAGIDLGGFDAVVSAEFRLTAFGATGNSGTFDIENDAALGGFGIVVDGAATAPVPLPPALVLMLGGLGLLGAVRLRAAGAGARAGRQCRVCGDA